MDQKPVAVFIPAYRMWPAVECTADITVIKTVRYLGGETEEVQDHYHAGQTYRQSFLSHAQDLVEKYPECFRLAEEREGLPEDAKEGRDYDRSDCTLLTYEGDSCSGYAFANGEEAYLRCDDEWRDLRGNPIDPAEGRIEWLPDPWILKVPCREYWEQEIQDQTDSIFCVYAVDRREHVRLCEFTPSHTLWFIEYQYQETEEVGEDEYKRDNLNTDILGEQGHEEEVSYMHVRDVDRLLKNEIKGGFLPKPGEGGGYWFGRDAVTWDGVMDEVLECRCNGL